MTDFDGTLAEIVPDPATAVPRPEAPALLARLARRLALVAVVSGRPVAFLERALGPASASLALAGLYGLERRGANEPTGAVTSASAALAAALADVGPLPSGAELEQKGATFVLHWRRAPEAAAELSRRADELARRHGLEVRPGKMAVELVPKGAADKGVVVASLGAPLGTVAFLGDDRGDLAAFAALDELARTGHRVARIAVVGPEAPPELIAAADCVVEGPAGAADLLEALAARLGV